MASERITLYLVPWLVLLGAAALGFSASQPKGALIATSTAQPTSSPVAASPEASATRPAPTPVIDWSEPPACQNQPQDLASWREELADRTESEATAGRFQAHLNQLRRYTPLLRDVSLGELSDILATPNSASAEDLHQRTLTVLWLNVISGRLNRATEITAPPAYTSKTVAELINELEQAQSGSAGFDQLLALADQVNSGHHLSRHVCARLLYRHGSVVEEAIWSDQGFVDLKYSLTNVPRGVTTFSPDNTQLIIETPRGDSGGGPLYLLDLQTAQLLNLNEHVGLPDYTGVCSLKVSGWHFDNRHVLLVNEDDEINIWLDLETGEYTPLALDVDTNHKSLPREFTLSPEGTGLAFTTFSDDAKHTHLHWYSLDDHSTSLMATLPITRGRLTAFSFSPTSQQAAYLVSLGKRSEGHHEELHLLDLNDTDSRALLSGYLGHIQPIWSPDGAQIAFTRRSHDKPRHAGPHVAPDYGDVWTISTSTGEAQQLTFIDAIKHPPVWSPDGQYLAFVTAAGQIGLVSVDQPGQIWRVETGSLTDPQFTELAFIP